MTDEPIYLDHNATTPVLPEAVEAMLPYLREHFGNPSSQHVYGQRARAAVQKAREQVAALLGSEPSEIVFTSGGTEANNLAIHGACDARPERKGLVTTMIEHPATSRLCERLASRGWNLRKLPVDEAGRARVDLAEEAIDATTALLTLMHANNETGVIQPVEDLARIAHRHGAWVHVDAAQSAGKIPVRVRELDVELLSVVSHKLYGPKGVGALYVRKGIALVPFTLGAPHERGLRPGTENVPAIVGFGVACEKARVDLDALGARLRGLRDRLFARLREGVPGLALNGHTEARLPNTLNVRFPRAEGSAVLANAPEVAASTGSACHEGKTTASPSILAMGVPPEEAVGSVRLTLGRSTTEADVDLAAAALIRAWRSLQG